MYHNNGHPRRLFCFVSATLLLAHRIYLPCFSLSTIVKHQGPLYLWLLSTPELLGFLALFLFCSSSVSSGSVATTRLLQNLRLCAISSKSSKVLWSGASWKSPVVVLSDLCSCKSLRSLATATLLGKCSSFSRSRCPMRCRSSCSNSGHNIK